MLLYRNRLNYNGDLGILCMHHYTKKLAFPQSGALARNAQLCYFYDSDYLINNLMAQPKAHFDHRTLIELREALNVNPYMDLIQNSGVCANMPENAKCIYLRAKSVSMEAVPNL